MVLDVIGEIVVGVVEAVGDVVGDAIGELFASDSASAAVPTVIDSGAAHGVSANGRSVVSTTARVTGEFAAHFSQELIDDSSVNDKKEKSELPVVEFVVEHGLYSASINNGFDFAKNYQNNEAAGAVKYPVIGLQDIPRGKIIKNADGLYFEFTTSHQFSTLHGERCNTSGKLRYLIIKT